jgi:hypothetical protein
MDLKCMCVTLSTKLQCVTRADVQRDTSFNLIIHCNSAVPPGLRSAPCDQFPGMNSWAIVSRPSGTGRMC